MWSTDKQTDRQTDRHLVADAGYEGLDVQLCWTALLAGSVSTLQTPGRLPESSSLTQRRVLDVIKILLLACAGLQQRDQTLTPLTMQVNKALQCHFRGGSRGGGVGGLQPPLLI